MPLLRKQPFHRQKIPHNLHPEEEVFHCKITNEIFRDYNAFFERIILCNSLVWSCAVTGKSGMTFQEAEENEEKAKKNLATFQDCLKKSLLFLATLTHRSRLNDLNDDIFLFAKDRFFIGETLDYISNQKRTPCKVVAVIPPPEEKSNGDVIVIDDSDDDSMGADSKGQKKKKGFGPDPMRFEYKVTLKGATSPITSTSVTLSRKRSLYTRDRSKLFLKQHCEPVNGLWMVKELFMKKLNIASMRYEDFFGGPAPEFEVSIVKRKNNAKSIEMPGSSIEFEEPPDMNHKGENGPQVEYVPMPTPEDRALMKEKLKQQKLEERKKIMEEKEKQREEMRKQIEAEKIRRKEEKDKERMKKMEEKRREIELFKEWSRPRDDLECDDLKEMPEFVPVRTRVPMELFGDAVMILEFVHIFKNIFDFKQFFPKGYTWGMVESALMDHEPDGPLCDLLQMLLCALFNLQEEEAEEYQELEKEEKKSIEDKDDDPDEEISANEMIKAATMMAQFSQNHLGMPLRDTLLDQFTLSEILRIHLLSSGARGTAKNARFRYQQRGGYTSQDDPGLELKLEDPTIVKALTYSNVFDLTPGQKTKIVTTLIQQILTYAMVRDTVEECGEKLRIRKYDFKQMQWAEQRREKEEQANKYKKMMEEKAREQARRMQQLYAEQNGLPLDVPPLQEMPEKSPAEKEAEKQKEHEMETRKKSEYAKKEYEMLEEIMSLQKTLSVVPVGRDRLFRRYYFFTTLNALFIEDHELHVPAAMLKPGVDTAGAGAKLKLLPELSLQGEARVNGIAGKSTGDDCIVISDDENGEKENKKGEKKLKTYSKNVEENGDKALMNSEEENGDKQADESNGHPSITKEDSSSELKNEMEESSIERKKEIEESSTVVKNEKEESSSGGKNEIEDSSAVVKKEKEESSTEGEKEIEDSTTVVKNEKEESSTEGKKENDSSSDMKNGKGPSIEVKKETEKLCAAKKEERTNSVPDRDSPPVLESIDSLPDQNLPQNPTWSFIDTPEHMDVLIACLNTRGFRESALKSSLMELKPLLKHSLRDCPSDMLSLPEDGGEEKARIQALAMTRGISSKKAAQDALMIEKAEVTMEINLRDAILDMEDRIHVGGLGTLKVNDRQVWRKALLKKSYDSQTNDPALNSSNKAHINGGDEVVSAAYVPVARDLAKALVQIARGVEQRFLREPLKEDESKKKKGKEKKKKEDDDSFEEEDQTTHKKTLHECWEESLFTATSLSQVYLHLATLDKSIVWAKSTLETRCRLCRRKGDPDKMLLCDGCDRGHHMYCLKPPLEKVPRGDWHCPECRPKQTPRSPMRKGKRKTFIVEEEPVEEQEQEEAMEEEEEVAEEEEEEDEEEEEEEEEEEVEEEEMEEDVTLDGKMEDTEEEEDDDLDVDSEDDDEEDEDDAEVETVVNPEDEVCTGCKTEGTLICCDCCPRAYHLHCAKPVLKKVPRGKWICQVCMGIEKSGKIKLPGLKFGKSSSKGKSSEKSKGKDKYSGSNKSTPNNSRPGSRRESPRDSPVLGGRPKKHPTSSLAFDDEGSSKPKKKRSRLSYEPVTEKNPIFRMMKPINPSSKRSNTHQQQLKAAEELVNELIKHEDAWPFLKPVDKKLVPDYYQVIKRPMDFGTIRNKIHAFTYTRPTEMLADVRLIFSNCVEYNARNSPEYKAYYRLCKVFDKRVKELSLLDDEATSVKNPKARVSV